MRVPRQWTILTVGLQVDMQRKKKQETKREISLVVPMTWGRVHANECAWLDFGECTCQIKPGSFNEVGRWIPHG